MSADTAIKTIAALLERDRIAQAKERLAEALREYPDDVTLQLQAAWAEYYDDNEPAAWAALQPVLAAEPDNPSARNLLFQLYLEEGDFAEAETVIIDLLNDYPEESVFYGFYAILMLKTMNIAKAQALAVEGLKYDPDDRGCLYSLSLTGLIEGKSDVSNTALEELVASDPDAIQTLILIFQNLNDRGENRAAYRVVQQLVRLQPDNEEIIEMAASLKASAHWTMLPLWPLQKFGWVASITLWVAAFVGLRALSQVDRPLAGILSICVLIYVAYSWIWPTLLRRIILRS
ncbi:tetratricopeptide repeat protein [Hwanghaeella grinnelliae]|nr:tetratricopeptide repeat protein [Hwanghaeella grinnelliae]